MAERQKSWQVAQQQQQAGRLSRPYNVSSVSLNHARAWDNPHEVLVATEEGMLIEVPPAT